MYNIINDLDDISLKDAAAQELAGILEQDNLLFHPGKKAEKLEEMNNDAVYVATGKNGSRFELEKGWDAATLATNVKG